MQYAAAHVSISAALDKSAFGSVRQQITSEIDAIGNWASTSLARSFSGVASGLGVAFAALKAVDSVKFGLGLAAEAEQAQVAFGVMLGSATQAQRLLGELKTFAAETPFEFPELRDAAKKLVAFGISADDVATTLRRIGDIASGVGAPVGELAELYGKAKVQGRLMAEDINQLTGRGIPIIQELAKQFGVAESQVRKLVEEGRVGFPNIEQAFRDLTSEGGKFANMMARQSETLGGLWSTLTDAIKTQIGKAGEAMVAAFDLKSLTKDMTELAEEADYVSESVYKIADVADVIHDSFLYAQAGVIGFFATIADGVARTLELLAMLPEGALATIPGAGPALAMLPFGDAASGARAFADSMIASGLAKLEEAQRAFADKTPSERAKALGNAMSSVADETTRAADSMKDIVSGTGAAAKSAETYWANLRDEVRRLKLGLTDEQYDLVKFYENPDVSANDKEEAVNLSRELRNLKDDEKAREITKDTATAAEQYAEKIQELTRLRDAGKLSPEAFERAKSAEQERVRRAAGIERDPMEELGNTIRDLMNLRDVGAIDDAAFERASAAAEAEAARKLGTPAQEEPARRSAPSTMGLAEFATKTQLAILGAKDPSERQMLASAKETSVATQKTAEYLASIVNNGIKTNSITRCSK